MTKELTRMLDAYVEETNNALSLGELESEYELIPFYEDGDMVGFFGVFISANDAGPCAIVSMLYIKPEHRDRRGAKLRKHFYKLTAMFKKMGIKSLQVDGSRAMGLIIEKYTDLKPISYRYHGPIDAWPTEYNKGKKRK